MGGGSLNVLAKLFRQKASLRRVKSVSNVSRRTEPNAHEAFPLVLGEFDLSLSFKIA